jgi:tRNA-specific 2-thiouridylase
MMVYLNSEGVRLRADSHNPVATATCQAKSLPSALRARGAIVVAMSGGVDSSVAAALLSQDGHDVVGVTLRLWSGEARGPEGSVPGRRCTAIDDAQAVAERLGIPHVVLDCGPTFERQVAQYFVAAYRRGETPNPCVPCNALLKFGALLDATRE